MRAHNAVLVTTSLALIALIGTVVVAGAGCPEAPPNAGAKLRVTSPQLDFGVVRIGTSVSGSVAVFNDGDAPYAPGAEPSLDAEPSSGDAFSLDASGCELPLAPHGLCNLVVTCTPPTDGPVPPSLDATVHVEGLADVPVHATVGGVRFDTTAVAFGVVAIADRTTEQITAENLGGDDVNATFTLETDGVDNPFSLPVPTTIPAGASATIDVSFSAIAIGARAATLTAHVCAPPETGEGCDVVIALSGTGGAAAIELSKTSVDFGVVAIGVPADDTFDITNSGDTPLTVSAVDIEAPAGFLTVDVDAASLPAEIAPGDAVTVTVTYDAPHAFAAFTGTLHVSSDDRAHATVDVAVTAATPGPGVAAAPLAVDFGDVTEGVPQTRDVTLTSTGTEDAVITAIVVTGGAPFSLVASSLPSLPLTLPVGDNVTVTVSEDARPVDLGPGATGDLVVDVTGVDSVDVPLSIAPGSTSGCRAAGPGLVGTVDLGNLFVGDSDTGFAVVRNVGTADCVLASADEGSPFDAVFTFDAADVAVIPPGGQGAVIWSATPTSKTRFDARIALHYENFPTALDVAATVVGVDETLTAAPQAVDFGPLPQACTFSVERAVTLQNAAAVDAVVERVEIELPGAPFDHDVQTPLIVPANGSATFAVFRQSDAIGVHTATLHVRGTANTVHLPLRLEVAPPGTPTTEHFDKSNFSPIDILWMIDNSGSMSPHQNELATNFQLFVNQQPIADDLVDFRMAIVTSDVDGFSGACSGQCGVFQGTPTVFDNNTPSLNTAFGTSATAVGDVGSSEERAFQAVYEALTDPNLTGPNAGFLRPEAALAVIIVSDEDDQSGPFCDPAIAPSGCGIIQQGTAANYGSTEAPPDQDGDGVFGDVSDYRDFLLALKGGGGVSVSAVKGSGLVRYDELVNDFGGITLDIGDSTWGTQLGQLGAQVFNAQVTQQFFFKLAAVPDDAGTVTATVDGSPVVIESIDLVRRVVKLAVAAPQGSSIDITYSPICP